MMTLADGWTFHQKATGDGSDKSRLAYYCGAAMCFGILRTAGELAKRPEDTAETWKNLKEELAKENVT